MAQPEVDRSARTGDLQPRSTRPSPRAAEPLSSEQTREPMPPSPALALQRRLGEALEGELHSPSSQNETPVWSARRRISFVVLSALGLWIAFGLAIKLLIGLL